MAAGGQISKIPLALCEKAPLEAHPGLARQGELDTHGLSDDVVAPTALGSFIPIRAGFRLLLKHLLEINDKYLLLPLYLSPLKLAITRPLVRASPSIRLFKVDVSSANSPHY